MARLEANLVKSDIIKQNMFERLVISAYHDGAITDFECTFLTLRSTELGKTPETANKLEKAVLEKLNLNRDDEA